MNKVSSLSPLQEWEDDELENLGKHQESGDYMFDFCEIEENLTFMGENENLIPDVSDEQQGFPAQPDTATLRTAMVLLGLFSIKFNFPAEAMGNL